MRRGDAGVVWRTVGAIGLAWGVVACPSGPEREARTLVEAVERFRRAENADRPAAVSFLQGVPCADSEVCAAKSACVVAVDSTAKALALQAEVTSGVEALEAKRMNADDPEAKALPEKLDRAEHLLREGRIAMAGCEERLDGLRHKYRF